MNATIEHDLAFMKHQRIPKNNKEPTYKMKLKRNKTIKFTIFQVKLFRS